MKHEPADAQKLAEFISNAGLKPRENKLSYIFDCPRCGKSERLWMFKDSGRFICWVCADSGFKGRPEFALTALTGRSVASIRKDLYGFNLPGADVFFELSLVDHWSDDADQVEVPNPAGLIRVLWSPDYYEIDHKFSQKGVDYLATRGISLELAKSYGLRYCPKDSRVAFPVGYQGALYGWQARYTGNTEIIIPETGRTIKIPKILSTDGLSGQRDKIVQFADQMFGSTQAIICEGPIDCIKAELCNPAPGIPAGNICTMGKIVSDGQIALIKYSGVQRVYLALDPDAATEATKLVKAFSPDLDVYLMEVPKQFKDFGEMTPEQVRRVYLKARKISAGHQFVYLKPFV